MALLFGLAAHDRAVMPPHVLKRLYHSLDFHCQPLAGHAVLLGSVCGMRSVHSLISSRGPSPSFLERRLGICFPGSAGSAAKAESMTPRRCAFKKIGGRDIRGSVAACECGLGSKA